MATEYAHTHLRADERMQSLKGSPLRDLFKALHKSELPRHMTGCDVDFVIVEKNPDVVVAFMDVKRPGEAVTFAEVIAYNTLLKQAPLYLLYTNGPEALEAGRFEVYQYLGGDRGPNPPTVAREPAARLASGEELGRWEQGLRDERKKRGGRWGWGAGCVWCWRCSSWGW